jgi:hypothetical protein
MKTFSATEAKNSFGEVLDLALIEPVQILKNGKTVAVMVSTVEFDSMIIDHKMANAKTRLILKDQEIINVLTAYSKGSIKKVVAMEKIGVKYQSQLLDLLGIANLPLPRLPDSILEKMAEEAVVATAGGF